MKRIPGGGSPGCNRAGKSRWCARPAPGNPGFGTAAPLRYFPRARAARSRCAFLPGEFDRSLSQAAGDPLPTVIRMYSYIGNQEKASTLDIIRDQAGVPYQATILLETKPPIERWSTPPQPTPSPERASCAQLRASAPHNPGLRNPVYRRNITRPGRRPRPGLAVYRKDEAGFPS